MSSMGGDISNAARPTLAVSLAVFREGRVLIARRARAPLKGLYSLPGGRVELGETLQDAALREVHEEVGVTAEIVAFNDHVESIVRDGRNIAAHYVIVSFVGRWLAGEARTSAEADSIRWIDPDSPLDAPATPGLGPIIAKAARIARAIG
ncbi:MAG TPA: NUDIX hydrolase [Roseiarcus sp.]|nr:NUDIX hydrolase [Roseiarcus sp.]